MYTLFDPVSCTSRLTHHFQSQHWHDQIPPFAWIPPSRVQTSQRPPALNTANDCNTKTWNTSSSIIIRYDEILWDIRVWIWVSFWVTWIQHQLNTMSLPYYLIWFPLTHWSSIALTFIAFGSEFPTLNSIPAQFSVATQWSLHSSMFATPRGFGARVSWLYGCVSQHTTKAYKTMQYNAVP